MKRKLAVLLGLTGVGIAIGGLLRRRRHVVPAHPSDPRAEDLRRRLAESRAAAAPAAAGSPPTEPAAEAESGADVEAGVEGNITETRRRVHEQGRAAVEEMRRSEAGPPA